MRFVGRLICLICAALTFIAVLPTTSQSQEHQRVKPKGLEPIPQPAIPAIVSAFDKYEVVGMPAAHSMKEMDDFIFSLIRTPAFLERVNDIAVECGNSLYQPVLDRYIVGEQVAFEEVRKVWRNTTMTMCGTSFYEQLFPLVRAINQKLPVEKRIRVLAGDPPIDWDRVKTNEDFFKFMDRDASIASVMEKEVLSKHRKALMLFGTFHLVHGPEQGAAVSIYEKKYPSLTLVISDFGEFEADSTVLSSSFATWPNPSLALAAGTWLGALEVGHFVPAGIMMSQDCKVQTGFSPNLRKPMENLVDAFLYLGLSALRLTEPMPADIALDVDYRMELKRRDVIAGFVHSSGTLKDDDKQILEGAESPINVAWKPSESELKQATQDCLDHKKQGGISK